MLDIPNWGYDPAQLDAALDLVEARKAALELLRPLLGVADFKTLQIEISSAFLRGV